MSVPSWALGDRNLNVRCTITFADSTTLVLSATQITSLSVNDSISDNGLGMGSANAASYSLTFYNPNKTYHPSNFDGASVVNEVGLYGGSTYVYKNLGKWYVTDVTFDEQSTLITLDGSDALGVLFDDLYEDASSNYPATLATMLSRVSQATGVQLKSTTFLNSTASVASMPDGWDEGVELRSIVAYIAACAGGFAHMTRDGKLGIYSFTGGTAYNMTPRYYRDFSMNGGKSFSFNALQVMYLDDDEYTRYAVDTTKTDDSTNTLQIDNNPLITATMAQAIVTQLSGLPTLESCSVEWGGDPSVLIGDRYTIQDLAGGSHTMIILSQSFEFSGGFSASESGYLPSTRESSDNYSTSVSVLNKDGTINYKAIAGLDKRVVTIDNDWAETHYMPLVDADGVKIEDGLLTVSSTGSIVLQANSALYFKTAQNANLISLSDDGITLGTGGKFTIASNNFAIDASGNVVMTGTVTAAAGSIGGWTLSANSLYSGTGSSYVALSSDTSGSYAMWAGDDTASEAPFRISRDGTVYMTNIAWVNKDGVVQPSLNLRTNIWKLNRAVQSMVVDDSTNTLTITLFDGESINFSKAAGITLTGAWASNTYTATATNGTETETCSTTLSGVVGSSIGYSVSGSVAYLTGTLGLYDSNSTQVGTFTAGTPTSGADSTIIITSVYNAIRNAVTLTKGSWSSGALTVSNSANSSTVSISLSQDTSSASATYTSSTNRYLVSIPITDGGSATGTSAVYSFDASDAYDAGYAAGWAAAYAMCSATRSSNVITVKMPSATPDVAAADITYTITAYTGTISAVSWPSVYSVVAKCTSSAQINGTTVNSHTRQTTLSK